MTKFSSAVTSTEHGVVHQPRMGDRTVTVVMPKALAEHHITGAPFSDTNDSMASIGEALSTRAPDLTHSGLLKASTALVTEKLAPAFRSAVASVPAARADLDKRSGSFDNLQFSDETPISVRVEQRQFAHTLSLPDLIAAATADPMLAASIVEGGPAMSRLPADIFERLRAGLMQDRVTAMFAHQGNYLTAPSATDPIGGKPDHARARAVAERTVAAWAAERELLDTAPAILSAVVNFAALITDTSPNEAYAMLSAAA